MSNLGQAVLTIAGTIIGSYFGYPQLGFMLGSLAGNALFPTELPTQRGPKLDDLAVQGSTVGVPIPLVYGAFRVAGNIIWATDLVETTTSEEVGGKGGPVQKVETTTYSVSFAVGLSGREITGIRRVWAGGKLIYDRRPQLPGESTTEFNNRMTAATVSDSMSALYLGTEDQLPDPTIESYEGLGNVPAYRGLAYIVFRDFQLADYGNNLMGTALSFEIIAGGAIDFQEVITNAPMYVAPFTGSSFGPFNLDNDHNITATLHRFYPFGHGPGTPANNWATSGIQNSHTLAIDGLLNSTQVDVGGHLIRPAWANYHILTTFCSKNFQTSSASQYTSIFGFAQVIEGAYRCTIYYSPFAEEDLFDIYKLEDIPGFGLAAKLEYLRVTVGVPEGAVVYIEFQLDANYNTSGNRVDTAPGNLWMWKTGVGGYTPAEVWDWHAAVGGAGVAQTQFDGGETWVSAELISLSGIRVPRKPDPPCDPRVPPHTDPPDAPYPGMCDVDGVYYEEGVDWVQHGPGGMSITEAKMLQRYNHRVDYRDQVGPLLYSSDTDFDNQTLWEAHYAEAVAAGTMPSGLVYSVPPSYSGDYPEEITDDTYWRLTAQQSFISSEAMNLALIVADLCQRSGLETAQYNVSQLTQSIDGYAIGRVMDAASAIQPLRLYGFFDMVESNGVLKFVVRGGASVATILEDDLSAHEAGSERPSAVEVSRAQDIELPRVLRVKYLMNEKDYEPGEQIASRLRTTANQVIDVEIPVAMTDALAAQIADVSLYESWQGRNTYKFSLSQRHLALEPTDPLLLPVDDGLQRVRIIGEDFSIPGIKQLQAVRDGGFTAYFSYVGGGAVLVPSQVLRLRDNSVAFYLDLPMLREADDDAGYYVALRQQNNLYLWPGGSILRSADLGATYLTAATATIQSVTGFVTAITTGGVPQVFLPPGVIETLDYTTELEVSLDLESQSLSSTTMAGILTGANAAAVGADGRWEIIQFLNAELTPASDGNTWKLSGLARGRRGTDYVTNLILGVPGDRFILLRNVVRAPQELASIGAPRLVKAITSGQPLDAQAPVSFTGNGEALKPISPVWIEATRDGGDNITLTWIRRSRFGQELPPGADLPLGEENERYDVEVYDGPPGDSGVVVVRTVTVTSPTWVYSSANQTTDFGSPQSQIFVRIYQLSTAVGRGHPGEGRYL